MSKHLLDRLRPKLSGFRGILQSDQPLAPIVWFRAGGPAEILAMPADAEILRFLMRALPEEIPVTIIGLGSNLLVRDGGVDGVVVRLSARGFGKVEIEGNRIRVGAAMADKRLAAHALGGGAGRLRLLPWHSRRHRRRASDECRRKRRRDVGARDRGGCDRPARRAPRALERRHGLLLSPRRRARRFHLRRSDISRARPRTSRKSGRRWMRCRSIAKKRSR